MTPVRGDLKTMWPRPAVGALVPMSGAAARTNHVVRAERVAGGIDRVVEEARGQAPAAQIVGDEGAVEGARADVSRSEIDIEISPVETVGWIAHVGPPLRGGLPEY